MASRSSLRLALCFATLALVAPPLTAATTELTPPRIKQTTAVAFPPSLLYRGVREGNAELVFLVDADGQLRDCMAIGYSHPAVAESALVAFRTWTFQPARRDGEPVPFRGQVSLELAVDGMVVINNVHDVNAKFMSRLDWRDSTSRLASAGEVDQLPVPLEASPPALPESYRGKDVTGTVLVDFYIDETGRVRMPAIARADDPALADVAMAAVSEWRFAPPTRDGRPVKVRARLPFEFGPTATTAAAR